MERTGIVAAAIAEGVASLEAGLWELGERVLGADLLTGERALQQVLRAVGGAVASVVLAQRAQGPEGEARRCPQCGGTLHLVGRERERRVLGLVGEYRFARPTFHCAACHVGHAPLDTVLGLGTERLSPGLAQVVCEQAQQGSFDQASRSVASSLGVFVDGETVRRLAEAVGGLIEHDQTDRAQWQVATDAVPTRVLVEMDGVHTPLLDGYHEAKVGRVAALGPAVRVDAETGRRLFALGPSTFCVGLESCDAFFPRLTREAWRAGVGRGVRQVIVLGDGARWIWHQARTQFSHPGVEVVEIVDCQHASEHLAEVAAAVYGEGSLAARTWWAAHKHTLLHQGPAPILAALRELLARPDLPESAQEVVRCNLEEYFTENAARLDYPTFIARQLPIGSGAVESACKLLISQRHKGAGMRWTAPGAQQIATLRALYHSAHRRWDTFWASRPLTRLRLLPAPAVGAPPVAVPAASPGALPDPLGAPPRAALDLPPPDRHPTATSALAQPSRRIATVGKPWAKGPRYWARLSLNHKQPA